MRTPILFDKLVVTAKDHPGKLSVISYVDVSVCNLNCYNCHNKWYYNNNTEVFPKNKEKYRFASREYIIKEVKDAVKMGIELFIISGGEPTMFSDELLKILPEIREIVPIRIDTNGTHPEEVEKLKEYVDGFAVDIKIPLEDKPEVSGYTKGLQKIIGEDSITIKQYMESVKRTIELVDDMKYTIYRTVKYPQYGKNKKGEQWFNDINDYISKLKSPYYTNPYFHVDK